MNQNIANMKPANNDKQLRLSKWDSSLKLRTNNRMSKWIKWLKN